MQEKTTTQISQESNPAIELRGISHHYQAQSKSVCALSSIDLSFRSGELTLIAGPSGSGKTTLLLAAGGMRRPSDGRVFVDGREIYGMLASERAALRANSLGFVFQSSSLIPYLSVLDNVMLAASEESTSLRSRAKERLGEFGLSDRLDHRPAQLSQGERQRVAMVRAVLNDPKAILADEPTGNLDPKNADRIVAALRQFADDGAAVVLVTHATRHRDVADKAYTLDSGTLAASLY